MKKYKYFLAISLVVNICALSVFFLRSNDENQIQRKYSAELERIGKTTNTYSEYDEEMLLFAGKLKKEYGSAGMASANYWESPMKKLELVELIQAGEDVIRNKLVSQYGETVVSNDLFSEYFFPLGDEFFFLSSSEQVELSKLKTSHRLKVASLKPGDFETPSKLLEFQREFDDSVRNLLSEEDFFEFQLRDSVVSNQMRMLNFDWTEDEFRAVFEIRGRTPEAVGVIASRSSGSVFRGQNSIYSQEIKDILGDRRYLEYLKDQDPIYYQLKNQFSSDRNLFFSSLDDVYRIFVQYQELIMRARTHSEVKELEEQRTKQVILETGVNPERLRLRGSTAFISSPRLVR